jgi:tRNA modification GTPase
VDSLKDSTDTIAAIATPLGVGGIAVIRISGEQAFPLIKRLTRLKNIKQNSAQVTTLYSFEKKQKLDQVVVTAFKNPHSYTGEDVIEVSCHGSLYLTKKILEETLLAGARLAKPGEFTKRAFLAGKIDLTQVEAVNEMIGAKSDLSAQLALKHLEGNVSQQIKKTRQCFLEVLALLEASIDFPEEIEPPSYKKITSLVNAASKTISALLKNSRQGLLIRQGITIALAGKANVGKSSLFNYLCQENKAIVTHIPGTTRDALEAEISLQGVKATLIDTAGLRKTKDIIETLGIAKTKEYLSAADLILYLIDAESGLSKEDKKILSGGTNKNIILVLNKIDLNPTISVPKAINISTKTGKGIAALENKILELMDLKNLDLSKHTYISSFRQQEKLIKVNESLDELKTQIEQIKNIDLLTIDVKNIIVQLGEITGEDVSEETIEYMFANFCVGK